MLSLEIRSNYQHVLSLVQKVNYLFCCILANGSFKLSTRVIKAPKILSKGLEMDVINFYD